MQVVQDRTLRIGLIVASGRSDHSSDDGDGDGVTAILSAAAEFENHDVFEVLYLTDYSLPQVNLVKGQHHDWWPEPSFTAALEWVRKLSALDAILFIVEGARGYLLLLNALEYVESELSLKPVDVIIVNADRSCRVESFRARLTELRALLLPNGFGLSESEADVQRQPFGDFFPKVYEVKTRQTLKDMIFVASALKVAV